MFEPVTYYHARCDGRLTGDKQCARVLRVLTHEDADIDDPAEWVPVLLDDPQLNGWRRYLVDARWLLARDGRRAAGPQIRHRDDERSAKERAP